MSEWFKQLRLKRYRRTVDRIQRGGRWYGISLFPLITALLILSVLVLLDIFETLNYRPPYLFYFGQSDYPTLDDYLKFLNLLLFFFFLPFAGFVLVLSPVLLIGRYFCLRRRADAILSYLYRTIRLGHPLASSLAIAGNSEPGTLGARLTVLSEVLQEGKTLGQALPLAVPEVRATDVAAITAAEEYGNLLSALKRVLAARSAWDFSSELNISYGLYLIVLAMTVIFVPAFFVPRLITLYAQFRGNYSNSDILWWNFYVLIYDFLEPIIPFIPVILFILLLFAAVILASRIFFPVFKRVRRFITIGDIVAWCIPFWGAIVQWRTWANVTAILHESALAGDELTAAVESAANSGINGIARWRLLRWKKKMEKGCSPKAAALFAGLPKLLCSNLDEATGSTFAGSLGFVHAIYQRRYEQAVTLIRGAMIPTTVICLGIIVLMTMLLLYLPYVTLLRVMVGGY